MFRKYDSQKQIVVWRVWFSRKHLEPHVLSSLTMNQVDNTGMLEFQEFKVFWEKMKKWIVRVDLCSKKVANKGPYKLYRNQPPGGDFRDLSLFL